jgi:hypothetical protein
LFEAARRRIYGGLPSGTRSSAIGLGADFVSEVDSAIRRIEVNPEQFQVVHQDIRHAITRRFPYGVFYRIRKNRIVISAVLHLERSDVPWQGKGASPEEPG